MTGTFTVSSPLLSLSFQNISGSVVSYSFNDGRQTLHDTNSQMGTFSISTDAAGSIIDWFIGVAISFPSPTAVGDEVRAIHTRNVFGNRDFGQIAVCTAVTDGSCTATSHDIANVFSAGSWTVTSVSNEVAVPEPSSLALMLAGLGLLGGLARRRLAAPRT